MIEMRRGDLFLGQMDRLLTTSEGDVDPVWPGSRRFETCLTISFRLASKPYNTEYASPLYGEDAGKGHGQHPHCDYLRRATSACCRRGALCHHGPRRPAIEIANTSTLGKILPYPTLCEVYTLPPRAGCLANANSYRVYTLI